MVAPDAVQLTAREGRLEHVARVHRAFRLAGPDQGVELVDEKNDLALLLGEVGEDRLHALLELAAKLRARDQRTHVEGEQSLALQAFGDLGIDDALRESLHDCGLADSRLADQHRVVLGAPLQDLNGAPDLVVAPDHRVEHTLLGPLGEIDGVLLQGAALLFRVRIVDRFAAPNVVDRLLDCRAGRAVGLEHPGEGAARVQHAEHE